MTQVRETIGAELDRVLGEVLPRRIDSACFIDPPASPNVGDPVIFLGQLDYMRRAHPGCRMWFVDQANYAPHMDRWIERTSVLLVQGGGNFGDIWQETHEFCLRILQRFAHKTIVQLPVSIHFSDPARASRTAGILAGLRDFRLMTRDQNSQDYALQHFPGEPTLAPDMAFAMAPITRKDPVVDYVCLLRSDREAAADHDAILDVLRGLNATFEVGDWLDETDHDLLAADARISSRLNRRPIAMWFQRGAALRARERYSRGRLAVGIERLSRGRTVITDRLHAHVLCCLLGIPHFVLDSFDGKVSAMHRTWTHAFPFARFVESPAALAGLLQSPPLPTAP